MLADGKLFPPSLMFCPETWDQCHITFTVSNLFIFGNKLERFVPGTPFQPSLMFADRLLALPKLEKLARDKHSSLLQTFVSYKEKGFIGLRQVDKVIKLFASQVYEFL